MRSAKTKATRLWIATTIGVFCFASAAIADDWPQWLGPQRDGVWREKGIVNRLPAKLKYLWRTKIGAGYAGPAVGQGRVIVTDRVLAPGATNPKNPFARNVAVPGKERVLCLDEKTGKILWRYEYDCPYQVSYASGPRCTPVIEADRVYTLGTMGHLFCFELETGKVVWSRHLPKDYATEVPLWGFAGHPLVDGDLLICLVGGKGSVVVAFDKRTGKEVWKNLTAPEPGYAPPVIHEIGGKRQLIVWHPTGIHALDPKTGKQYWSYRHPKRGQLRAGLSIPTPRYDPETRRLFVTAFYNGPLMLQVNAEGTGAKALWAGKRIGALPEQTDGLHSIMPTPFLKHGHIYGVCSYGELRCLDAETGKRLWMTRKPTTADEKPLRWANAFLVEHEDRFFLFNELGDLIIAHLSPKGYQEFSRRNILRPTNAMAGFRGRRLVVWSHPAFANRCVVARNDEEIVRISLAEEDYRETPEQD